MALEDLTGPAKFIDALVTGNPVSNDDRREGDDHIRGLKNVLRNTFVNLNGAVTLTDEQINALPAATAAALLKASNLSDLASVITALVNLGFADAQGHWTIKAPTAPGTTLNVVSPFQDGTAVLTLTNQAAGYPQAFIAHDDAAVQFGNARGAGATVNFNIGGFVGPVINWLGEMTHNHKAGAAGPLQVLKAVSGAWHQSMDGGSGLFQTMYQPGSGGKSMTLEVNTNTANPTFSINAKGAGAAMALLAGTSGLYVVSGAAPVLTVAPIDAANDTTIATTAFVHAHTAGGIGSWYGTVAAPAFGTAYRNTSNKPRYTNVVVNATAGGDFTVEMSPDGAGYGPIARQTAGATGWLTLPVMWAPGIYLRVGGSGGSLNAIYYST